MATYRLYLLDARSRITWGEWFECASAEEAERIGRSRCVHGVPSVEVWLGSDCLYRIQCPERHVGPAAGGEKGFDLLRDQS